MSKSSAAVLPWTFFHLDVTKQSSAALLRARVPSCVTLKRSCCLFFLLLLLVLHPRLLSWKLRCLHVGSWHCLTLCGWRFFFFFFSFFLKSLPTLCQPSQKLTSGWSGQIHSRLVSNWLLGRALAFLSRDATMQCVGFACTERLARCKVSRLQRTAAL